ncbi:MAG: hypothetical protein RLO51_11155 [Thalassobaculum sp.]|uniref:hypothetical protein n=1 Tax=Thalassobaculum sp. TaxID=2022740 RepID=UPI0032ED727E
MYTTLIPAIETILTGVEAVKAVYSYPLPGNPKTYPAVVFMPDTFENSFETTTENMKAYRFKLWVVVDLAGTNEETAFTSVLPNVVDDVIAAFDAAWNGGAFEGHRIWYLLDSGLWGLSEEQKAKRAFAELTLTVRLVTSN